MGIRDPEKTYPGSRGQKGTRSRIRISNTGFSQGLSIWTADGFRIDKITPPSTCSQYDSFAVKIHTIWGKYINSESNHIRMPLRHCARIQVEAPVWQKTFV
jgi:hypothetical protein